MGLRMAEIMRTTVSRWCRMEPVKLGMASLAIAFIQICMARLSPVLAAAQTYGDEHVNFMSFRAFLQLCRSTTTCCVAGLLIMVQAKNKFTVKAPVYAYAVIALAAAIAVAAEKEMEHGLGEQLDLAWQCLIIFVVMALQMIMLQREFLKRDWLVSTLFVCGCFVSALPWISANTSNPTPWYLVLGGSIVAFLYLGLEGLNQTYQDKLFCDLDTAIREQVLFISLFASVIRLIEFLWESRCIEALVFHVKHPLSFTSVLLLSFMGAAMTFLMSYMLHLCGALICVMIHQIMVNTLAGMGKDFHTVDYMSKWGGILLMLGMLGITMLKMKHGSHNEVDDNSIFQLTDMDLEELEDPEWNSEPLLSSPKQMSHGDLELTSH